LNIVVIGYRGTGKNVIARTLAKKIGFSFLDTDKMVVKKTGLSIPEIFSQLGEPHFRDLETEAIKEACSNNNCVIATGGGAPTRKQNSDAMKENGIIVLLEAAPEVIYQRIKGDSNRPALTNLNDEFKEIKVMLEKRNPTYHSLANFVTDTSTKTVQQNVDEIISFLRKKGVVQ